MVLILRALSECPSACSLMSSSGNWTPVEDAFLSLILNLRPVAARDRATAYSRRDGSVTSTLFPIFETTPCQGGLDSLYKARAAQFQASTLALRLRISVIFGRGTLTYL